MTQDLIIGTNITKDFYSEDARTRVLDNVSLKVQKGQLTMIVGPSGCGKTTLISIIAGILTPTSGTIQFDGVNILKLSNLQKTLLRQKNIGFVFQQYNLLGTLTAAENAAIPLIAANVPFETAKKKAARILQTLGMGDHVNKNPAALSGGEQQRVAIARALVHDPQFIVCDEPTASLDEKNGHKILKILKNISTNPNKSVLIVTHDNRIFNYADSIIHMNDGKVLENAPSEIS